MDYNISRFQFSIFLFYFEQNLSLSRDETKYCPNVRYNISIFFNYARCNIGHTGKVFNITFLGNLRAQ